jgi:hypothetical protein
LRHPMIIIGDTRNHVNVRVDVIHREVPGVGRFQLGS